MFVGSADAYRAAFGERTAQLVTALKKRENNYKSKLQRDIQKYCDAKYWTTTDHTTLSFTCSRDMGGGLYNFHH
eukprot:g13881.t1